MKKFYKILFLFFLMNFSGVLSAKNNSNTNFAPPTASITANATSVCLGGTSPIITFTGSGGTVPYTFTYKIGTAADVTIVSTGNSATVNVPTTATGTFTYTLVSVKDSSGEIQTQTDSVAVTVNAPPTVDFSFDDNKCSGSSVQFTSSITGTGPYSYSWDFGNGNTSTQQNPSHSFTELGCGTSIVTVKLTVSGGGCSVSKTKTINVIQRPDINFIDVNNQFDPFSNCTNATTNPIYTITVGNSSLSMTCISSYSINWGDGSSQNNVTFPIQHTYNSNGAYNMIITGIGTNGCISSKNYIIKNVSNPLGGLNSPGSTQNLCAPTTNLQFSMSNWGSNSLDTTYNINYSDGSPIVVLTQNQLNSSPYYNSANPSNSANYPIPHVYTKSSCPASSFEVKLNVTNACGTTPFTLGNISILTKPEANFNAPTNGCINNSILFTNTTVSGYGQNCVQGSIYSWNFGDGSPIVTTPISSPLNINHTYTTAGSFTVTLITQNGCGTTTKTQQICIEKPLIPTFTLDKISGCTPLSVTTTNSTNLLGSCTTPTYQWNVTYSATNCGTTSNYTLLNGTTLTSFAPEFNFINPGTYSITLTTNNSCGSVTSASQTVIVKQPPTATINPIANVCQTGSSTAINPTATVPICANATYAWSFPGGIPATSSLAVPGAISYPTTGTFTVSLSVTNECGTTVAGNQTFTINPSPTITGTLFSCVGFTSQLTGSATANTINPWTSSTPSVATVSPTGLVTGVSGGTTTITYTNANNCKVTELFTVNPAPTITQPTSSTVCIGGSPTVLSVTISGATGTPAYQWYSNNANNTSTGTAIPFETNANYTPPATIAGTLYYYCIITLPTGGCSSIKTNTATVTVIPNTTITTQPTPTQNLCVGVTVPTPLTFAYSGGTGTVTYQWYSNTVNATTGGSLIATATSDKYTPPSFTIPGKYYYYATVSLNGNGCFPATTNAAEVFVYADPTISAQPLATQTLCQNATSLNLDVTATGGNGTFMYQWYSNSTDTNTGGVLIPGATSNSYIPPTNAVVTKYYYCIVSQNSTYGCSVTSSTAAIIVISAPTISQPTPSNVCIGGSPTALSITVSGATGTPTYQWYSNTLNTTTAGTAIVGEITNTYTPSTSTPGTTYYYCIITLPSGGCSSITSNTAAVAISAGATIDSHPTPIQNLCVGGTISTPLNVTYSGGTGTATYQWYSNSSSTNSGGNPISGATNASYTPPVFTTTGTFYYYAVVTLSGNGCGPITSNISKIIIVADPVVSSQPLPSQTVCQTATPSGLVVTVTGGITASYSYQWFSNASNNTTSGTPISWATNDTYLPPTNLVGTIYYYCIITQTNGSGCNVSSNTAAVMVNLAPKITSEPVSSTICIGQTPTLLSVSYTNGVGTPTYQWYSNSVNTISGSSPIAGATNTNYAPPNSVVGIVYYYCVITLPATGGCSNLTSTIASVTVNQNPVISNKNLLICSDNAFTITPDTSSGDIVPMGTTYTWTNPIIAPAGSITGASAQNIQQNNISQTLINTTTNPSTVSYTVTPLSGVCTGINFTITVTVNPAISPNVTSTNNTCFGSDNAAIQTNITGGIPFSSGAPYLISWTGPDGFTSTASSISNLEPGNYTLSITDAGGCPINETYLITEPDDIIISTISEKDITCFNDANGAIEIAVSGGTLNYTFAWMKDGIPYSTTEDLSNLNPGTYIVSVSDANICGPKTATFTITEPPILAVSLGNKNNILCFGDATGTITVNVLGGTLPYTYAWTGPNGFTSSNQNLTAIFAGAYDLVVTDNSGCSKNLSVTLTQTPEIIIQATPTPIICYGGNDASIYIVVSGGVAPYQILWSNLGIGTFQDNLSAGDYIITVTDALSCTKKLKVNIPEAPIFTVNPVVKNISCHGANDGSIALNFVGGIPPINLTWSDGSNAGTTRNNLKPGTYSVTIIDGKPCTITKKFVILEPQLLVLSANLTNAFNCDDANSGAINLLVSGGSTPFTYTWSNGATTEDLANIPAGNYLVTVTDANGCTQQAQYSINRPPPIVPGVQTKTDFNCETKTIKQTFVADVSGGVPPYILTWSSGTVSGANNEMMTTNQNGSVILNVIDAIGCKANYTFNVDLPELGTPSFDASSYAYLTYGMYSINDSIQFSNTATGDYISIVWDFGDGSVSTDLNPIHTFINPKEYVVTQTVTYPLGCIYVQKIIFNVGKGYVLVVPNAFTPNKDTLNDFFRPVTKGLKNVRLDVYDTWGSLIYSETGTVLRGWDAKIKASNAENGNYYCKVSGETFYGTIVNENHPFVLIK
jgi:gliding motility-associated-like protein